MICPARQIARRSERGYILITVLLFVALMTIAAVAMLPVFTQQMKRDREEELIHRGVQYSRAMKHFVKKFGRYPTRIEELENTNNVRFLRRRYKDPITGKEFKILHMGDVQMSFGAGLAGATPAGGLTPGGLNPGGPGVAGGPGAFGASGAGAFNNVNGLAASGGLAAAGANPGNLAAQQIGGPGVGNSGFGNSGFGNSGFGGAGFGAGGTAATSGSNSTAGQNSNETDASGAANGQTPNLGGGSASTPGSPGQGAAGPGGQTFGGGPMVGVASTSKEKSIRVFNKKDHYYQWQFIYDPSTDRGGLLTTPNQPPLQDEDQAGARTTPSTPGTTPGSGAFGTSGGIPGQPSPGPVQQPGQPPQSGSPTPQMPPEQ